jgi:hypothetical protein
MGFDSCDRCGTVVVTILDHPEDNPHRRRAYVPKLVDRCRELEQYLTGDQQTALEWIGIKFRQLGLAESIHPPGERK